MIPVKDEEATVDALLASIDAQTQPVDEVVFVDSGSSDGTVARLRNASLGNTPIHVIESGPGSP